MDYRLTPEQYWSLIDMICRLTGAMDATTKEHRRKNETVVADYFDELIADANKVRAACNHERVQRLPSADNTITATATTVTSYENRID